MISNINLNRQNYNKNLSFGAVHVLEIPQKYNIKTKNDFDTFLRSNWNGELQQELLNTFSAFEDMVEKFTTPEDLKVAPSVGHICRIKGKGVLARFTGEDAKDVKIAGIKDVQNLPPSDLLEQVNKNELDVLKKATKLAMEKGIIYRVFCPGAFKRITK